ncbi:heavy-metal-associated domain-containing protein [Inquilinus limosus]|uniref:heavy-metal-associated domain-containing protein n=1 Tax=Inquilinus limosus TaxID=171674 RepID=UPI003F190208
MELKVEGMTCGGCAEAVKRAVRAVAPGAEVAVDLAGGRVTVSPSGAAPDAAAVAAAIDRAGFHAHVTG